ncbi:SIR2-like domain-containing protein [Magnetospirillum fulvum]|uniref:SIR2-like domain-containing protein n=2 Tax=Magnetospirillum fulvum TaxID=1082 RepID=A0A1H6JXA3_MAGFU|nr:SIR2-like domain-containing protein [Magnetospirillum fulvum]
MLLADVEARKLRRGHVRAIRSLPDPWDAFSTLKGAMAPSSYHSVIKSELSYSDDAPLPEVIKKIWRLRTYGVVTLNIDTLLSRAFAEVRGLLPQHGVGYALQKKIRLMQSDKQWIINLHGIVDDEETWVFTREDLANLFADYAYKLFMKTLFLSNRVIFLGIGADDLAIKRHLDELKTSGIPLDVHYWITDRADIKTAQWAAGHNIKTIFYPPAGSDHQTPLLRIFDALDGHIERYKAAAPVTPSTPPSNVALTPQEIKEKSPEEARAILSSYAAKVLATKNKVDAENNYENFLRAYTEAVNHAALIEDFPPYNVVFGCQLMPPTIGGGAFGRVYLAQKGGNKLAVKIINNNVRSDRIMLNSFRQGVESLGMIRDAQIPGVVEIIDPYEIPPTTIMEYIEG